MKLQLKRPASLLLALSICAALAGCGSTAETSSQATEETASEEAVSGSDAEDAYAYLADFDYSAVFDEKGYLKGVTALDYVTLPEDFEHLTLPADAESVSAKEISEYITDNVLSNYATTAQETGRAAENGDSVNIDYVGSIDGVEFEGGNSGGNGYDLTLGSGTFIDDFEDQIVGHNIGDTCDVNVTFTTGYNDSTDAEGNAITLSGKAAVFSVTLNSISQSVTPELTDAWVDTTFGTSDGLHTVEALRCYYAAALQDSDLENALMDALLDGAQFKELPKEVTSYYIRLYLNYYYSLASNYYQTDLETFAKANGYADADAMMADSDSMFTHLAKQDLLYQAIAETQNIQPTQEQLDTAAASYSADLYGENFIYQTALQNAVMDWLKSTAVIS